MVVSLCFVAMCLLEALYLAFNLSYGSAEKTESEKRGGFSTRTVVQGEFVPAPPLDLDAIRGYRRTLSVPLFPSARLNESMTEAEKRALLRYGTDKPFVLAKASHPSRRGAIRNLIAACRDDFFVVVTGAYTEGLTLRNGAFTAQFPERFASLIYDGTLNRNPLFMILARAEAGVTAGGVTEPLPSSAFYPVLGRFDYALDVTSSGFGIRTHGAASFVWIPETRLYGVRASRGVIRIRCEDGETVVRVSGGSARVRPVATKDGIGVRIASDSASEILFATERGFTELYQSHAAFCANHTLLRFRADAESERLYELCMRTVYGIRLKVQRARRVESLKDLAAILASGFENIDGLEQCLPAEGAALGALMRLCVKSYRGIALNPDEYLTLRAAAEKCRAQGGLYRAAAFKLMGMTAPYYRQNPAFSSLHYSLVSDTSELLSYFDSGSVTERGLFGCLLAGLPAPNVEEILADFDRLSDYGVLAAYLYVRAELVGVKLKYGAILCEPTLETLTSIDLADRHIEVGRDSEGGILVGNVRFYTNALPKEAKDIDLKVSNV